MSRIGFVVLSLDTIIIVITTELSGGVQISVALGVRPAPISGESRNNQALDVSDSEKPTGSSPVDPGEINGAYR